VDSDLDPLTNNSRSPMEMTPKYFDIIGFDPPGVGNMTPHLNCFPDTFSRQAWSLQTEAEGTFGSSGEAFATIWARSKAWAQSCSMMSATGEDGGRISPIPSRLE
jgi:hypothetical protein